MPKVRIPRLERKDDDQSYPCAPLAETDVRIGGRFRVRFRKLDGTEHESTGEYLELIESKRLVMSWQWTSGGEPEEDGEVSRIASHAKEAQ
jgi:uncharacterized protein YndB with AHSA1/START domain